MVVMRMMLYERISSAPIDSLKAGISFPVRICSDMLRMKVVLFDRFSSIAVACVREDRAPRDPVVKDDPVADPAAARDSVWVFSVLFCNIDCRVENTVGVIVDEGFSGFWYVGA